MKRKSLILTLLVLGGIALSTSAQTKIGYCNIEAILVRMPETQTMNQQLQTYRQKLSEGLQTKEQYAQTKMQEYQEKAQAGATEDDLKPLQEELMKLDQELSSENQEAQQKLMEKRNELLAPITEKIDKAIKDYAQANGYTYILNTVDGSGVSIILNAPEEDNVTRSIMESLGIKIEDSEGK